MQPCRGNLVGNGTWLTHFGSLFEKPVYVEWWQGPFCSTRCISATYILLGFGISQERLSCHARVTICSSQHQTHNIYQRKLLLSDFQSCCHIHLKVSEVSEINKVHLLSAKLDGVKTYMRLRRVPNSLQNKVIKWFDYLWLTQKSSDEEKAVSCLPGTLYCQFYLVIFRD